MFGSINEYVGGGTSGATFDDDTRYRYTLFRRWDVNAEYRDMVAFVGLNPSTADAIKNDPTVTRCINFAKSWGFGGMIMLNLFAFRATDPNDMKAAVDPVGQHNDEALRIVSFHARQTICCWGTHGVYRDRERRVREILLGECYHLGLTKDGHPKHPLYLKSSTPRTRFDLDVAA